jgi:hypothetical protein
MKTRKQVDLGDGVPLISASIITWNEVDRIAECIGSLRFCDEIVVVDSCSDDGTAEKAREVGARVIEQVWLGYAEQKEFAIRATRNDWVLCVDADERVSVELREEILAQQAKGFRGAVGYDMPRLSLYHEQWIRHGTWYPDRQLRLFDRRRGFWGGANPHDRVELQGPTRKLKGDLVHFPYRSVAEQIATIDEYTSIAARGLQKNGCPFAGVRSVANPIFRVIRSFLLKRGFLDGRRGLVLAVMEARYARLKYLKLIDLRNNAEALESSSNPRIKKLLRIPFEVEA